MTTPQHLQCIQLDLLWKFQDVLAESFLPNLQHGPLTRRIVLQSSSAASAARAMANRGIEQLSASWRIPRIREQCAA